MTQEYVCRSKTGRTVATFNDFFRARVFVTSRSKHGVRLSLYRRVVEEYVIPEEDVLL